MVERWTDESLDSLDSRVAGIIEFHDRPAIIATMHRKEIAIAPILESTLGLKTLVPQNFDSDVFGTFTRDIDRPANQIETAKLKAIRGLEQWQEAEIAKSHPNIRVLKNYGDTGKGHAIKIGISVATHDVMAQVDADLQFMPEELPKLLEPIFRNEADITFGARFMPDSDVQHYKFSFFRVMGNRTVNAYFSFLTGLRFYDITTGHKAWTRKAIEDINFKTTVLFMRLKSRSRER